MRKVISVDARRLTAFPPEMINYELPTLARNRNRDLQADAWNMNLSVGFRLGLLRRVQ
ncbi:MAG TPA: hypothetical protein VII30_03490 [Gemmatimonadaceae bacterium]